MDRQKQILIEVAGKQLYQFRKTDVLPPTRFVENYLFLFVSDPCLLCSDLISVSLPFLDGHTR